VEADLLSVQILQGKVRRPVAHLKPTGAPAACPVAPSDVLAPDAFRPVDPLAVGRVTAISATSTATIPIQRQPE